MHLATFTVDGFAGAGVALQAVVLEDIREFAVDVDKQMLKLTDEAGKVTNIAINSAVTITVTVSGTYITAVSVAD